MKKKTDQKEAEIEIGLIDGPVDQMRMEIDPESIGELAQSIKQLGQMQAILIRPVGKRYEIVYGHRRFLACSKLGMARIRATVKELNDEQCLMMRATENIARQDVSPIEEAKVYKALSETLGMTIDKISEKMGRSYALVKRRLDLLKMPPCLISAIHKKEIGYAVAEELWRLREIGLIEYFLGFAVDHGATLKVVRAWVDEKLNEIRREQAGDVGRHRDMSPMESRPVYVACDTCNQAMEIGKETIYRCCPVCSKSIRDALAQT